MKVLISIMICLLFWQCGATNEIAEEENIAGHPENLEIYLLIGQSNMAGRASIDGSDKDTLQNVFLFTGIIDNEWEKAANPLNKYSSIRKKLSMQKMGPGYHFAKQMVKEYNNIGLVVNAKGGTKIEEWMPDGEFYKEAVKRTKEAMKFGNLKGILWHQGEGNSSKYQEYTPKIIALIQAFRKDFHRSNLPVVVGQLSGDKSSREGFNKMILQLPEKLDRVGVALSEGTSTIDSTHFDAASQKMLGIRYAKEMQTLLENDN